MHVLSLGAAEPGNFEEHLKALSYLGTEEGTRRVDEGEGKPIPNSALFPRTPLVSSRQSTGSSGRFLSDCLRLSRSRAGWLTRRLVLAGLAKLEARKTAALGADYLSNWSTGLPYHDECTEAQINVRIILWLRILVRSFGMT